MNSKSLLIAIAAFAVTATGAQAYTGTTQLNRTGLSSVQAQAFSEARELRQRGRGEEARDILLDAGIDENAIESLRAATAATHVAIDLAVQNNDFAAFRTAVAGTPLYDIVTTADDFAAYAVAHELRTVGHFISEHSAAPTDAGDTTPWFDEVEEASAATAEFTADALRVALQSNDQATVLAIQKELGLRE
jgi:hypothetical protein